MKLPEGTRFSSNAGQFIYLRIVNSAVSSEEHPFTLSSGENCDPTVTVKELGNYTSSLTTVLPGDIVLIDGPYGKFTPVQDNSPKLFIAGGIGITPFLSILSTWKETNHSTPVTLLWSVMEKKYLFDISLLEAIEKECDWFRLELYITKGECEPYQQGIINQDVLKSVVPTLSDVEAYLCGPERMTNAIVSSLEEGGVPPISIHLEKFSF